MAGPRRGLRPWRRVALAELLHAAIADVRDVDVALPVEHDILGVEIHSMTDFDRARVQPPDSLVFGMVLGCNRLGQRVGADGAGRNPLG